MMTGREIAREIRKLPFWNRWGNLTVAVRRLERVWEWNERSRGPDEECDHLYQILHREISPGMRVEVLHCIKCGHDENR